MLAFLLAGALLGCAHTPRTAPTDPPAAAPAVTPAPLPPDTPIADLPRVTVRVRADGTGEIEGVPFALDARGQHADALGAQLRELAAAKPGHIAWVELPSGAASPSLREAVRRAAYEAGFPAVVCTTDDTVDVHLPRGQAIGPERLPDGAILLGALPKEEIDRVIKSQISQVRYCYQRALTKDPKLEGRVTVKFVIQADGTVSSATAKENTVPDESVASCICGRFMRFVFPKPDPAGAVIVSYPFVFSPN